MLTPREISQSLQSCPVGYLKPNHILLTASNSNLLHHYKKLGAISTKIETCNDSASVFNQICCNVLGCTSVFDNVSSYQTHYNVMHRFICAECKKPLPTDHLLDLHLSEYHDTYFLARIERGERLFKCYLEECEEKFGNVHERKEHCIKQHKFPSNFRFDQIGNKYILDKIDKSPKILHPPEIGVQLKEGAYKKSRGLKMISFGHQKEKTFCSRNSDRKKGETSKAFDDMKTLEKALDSD